MQHHKLFTLNPLMFYGDNLWIPGVNPCLVSGVLYRWIIAIKASIKKWLPLHQALQNYMNRPLEETRMWATDSSLSYTTNQWMLQILPCIPCAMGFSISWNLIYRAETVWISERTPLLIFYFLVLWLSQYSRAWKWNNFLT